MPQVGHPVNKISMQTSSLSPSSTPQQYLPRIGPNEVGRGKCPCLRGSYKMWMCGTGSAGYWWCHIYCYYHGYSRILTLFGILYTIHQHLHISKGRKTTGAGGGKAESVHEDSVSRTTGVVCQEAVEGVHLGIRRYWAV